MPPFRPRFLLTPCSKFRGHLRPASIAFLNALALSIIREAPCTAARKTYSLLFHSIPPTHLNLSLATELALGTNLTGYTGDFRGENRQLLDHRVHELRRAKKLALERTPIDFELHRLPKVTAAHCAAESRS
jgi:hypothetical protein